MTKSSIHHEGCKFKIFIHLIKQPKNVQTKNRWNLPEETDKPCFLETGSRLSEHTLPSFFSRRHCTAGNRQWFTVINSASSHLAVARLRRLVLPFLCGAGVRALEPLGVPVSWIVAQPLQCLNLQSPLTSFPVGVSCWWQWCAPGMAFPPQPLP